MQSEESITPIYVQCENVADCVQVCGTWITHYNNDQPNFLPIQDLIWSLFGQWNIHSQCMGNFLKNFSIKSVVQDILD